MKAMIDVPDGTYKLIVHAFWHQDDPDGTFRGGMNELEYKLKEDDGKTV